MKIRPMPLALAATRKLRSEGWREFTRNLIGLASKRVRFAGPPADRADPFDATFGTETSGVVPLWTIPIQSKWAAFGTRYQATDPDLFETLIASLAIDPESYTFVDIGSGKGRAVMMAAEMGFRSAVGVEFSADLHAIAERNVEIYAGTSAAHARVRLVLMDACDYRFPRENLVVYFYNPFQTIVLERVIENLDAVSAEGRSDIFIVYLNYPRECSVVERHRYGRIPAPDGIGVFRNRSSGPAEPEDNAARPFPSGA